MAKPATPSLLKASKAILEWMEKSGDTHTKPAGVGVFRTAPVEYSVVAALRRAILAAQRPQPLPEILIEIEGGMVKSLMSNRPVSVAVYDWDTIKNGGAMRSPSTKCEAGPLHAFNQALAVAELRRQGFLHAP